MQDDDTQHHDLEMSDLEMTPTDWLTLKLNLTMFWGAWGLTAVRTRVCSSFIS